MIILYKHHFKDFISSATYFVAAATGELVYIGIDAVVLVSITCGECFGVALDNYNGPYLVRLAATQKMTDQICF